MAQATAHEIINVGCTAQSEAYVHLARGNHREPKHQETLQQVLAKADQVWKDTNDIV